LSDIIIISELLWCSYRVRIAY